MAHEPGMPQKVPWRALVDHGVVLTSGRRSLLRTYRLRGKDLDAAMKEVQGAIMWQLNKTFMSLGGSWALHDEAQRRRVTTYPYVSWPHPVATFVDEVRRDAIVGRPDRHPRTLETSYYLTMRWRMPSRVRSWLTRALLTNAPPAHSARGIPLDVERFRDAADHIAYLLRGVLTICEPLYSEDLLTYLYSTVNPIPHRIAVPRDRRRLHYDLCDTPFVGGWDPRLGRFHVRVCSVTNYPETSIAMALARVDDVPFELRRVTRLIAWDKLVARGMFRRVQHGWLSQRDGPIGIMERSRGRQPEVQDTHAENRARDADAARQEVSGDYVGYGHFTSVVVVWDEDPDAADTKLSGVQQIFEGEGFTVKVETAHSRQAFHSTVPGNLTDNVRRHAMSTLSWAHWSAGLKAIWPGPEHDISFQQAGYCALPWFLAHTQGSTLFRVINHVHGVGHTLVPGPTGFGKTSLLDFLSLRWLQYWPCQVFRFTVGGGEEALTRCIDGIYCDLGSTGMGSQPYRLIDQVDERDWAVQWTFDRLKEVEIVLTDTVRSFVTEGLTQLSTAPIARRTITELVYILTAIMAKAEISSRNPNAPYVKELKEAVAEQRHVIRALSTYTGGLLDSSFEDMTDGWYVTFEQATLLTKKRLAPAILSYRFHRIEQRLTGIPTLIELDESTIPMVIPDYAETLPEWVMTKRKQFASLVIATPLMALLEQQSLRPLLMQSCPTTILTPNLAAMAPDVAEVYRAMGLNDTMIEQIATARPAFEYFYKSPLGYRRFQLDLGGVLGCFCGSTNAPEEQELVAKILGEGRDEPFAVSWVRARGFPEEADRLLATWRLPTLQRAVR